MSRPISPVVVLTLWTLMLVALLLTTSFNTFHPARVRVEIVVVPADDVADDADSIDAPDTGNAVNSGLLL